MKHPKSAEARAAEAREIEGRLREIGFPDETLAPFRRVLKEFEVSGTSFTGTIKLEGFDVAIVAKLSAQAHVASVARIARL